MPAHPHRFTVIDPAPRHRRLVSVVALVLALSSATVAMPPLVAQFWLIIFPVVILGLPHGGADSLLLKVLSRETSISVGLWLAGYLGLIVAFIALIWWMPTLALVLFLALSIWHFSFTDALFLPFEGRNWSAWLSGSLVILGPLLGHPQQSAALFAWLLWQTPEIVLPMLLVVGKIGALLWLAGFGLLLAGAARPWSFMLELLALAAAMILLPPLLAFAYYFCMVHAMRHFLLLLADQRQQGITEKLGHVAGRAAFTTLITVALALAIWLWFAMPFDSIHAFEMPLTVSAFRVVFWGLAALTVPHAFLVAFWTTRHALIRFATS
nr:Brp/Blh family beta-carotene 15,15'-dioxygenase [uncultured Halomonas sp.]